jgi:thiosulfate/3-mercaptopyruvate sulfurtransferase
LVAFDTKEAAMNELIVTPESLAPHLRYANVLVVDCRFDLADTAKGARDFETAHIPGAVYANLDTDLSDLTQQGLGRHPLPTDATIAAAFSRWNLTPDIHVVAVDDATGALAAARLWWLLRLANHERASVLDGGLAAWRAAGLPLESGPEAKRPQTNVDAKLERSEVVWTDELERRRHDGTCVLIDARAAPRYRGEVEPIDKKAGHIPGALNRPFSENLDTNGRFKSAEHIRGEFYALIGPRQPHEVVHMCGSGVTACHNLLAMEAAGMLGSRVYAPSWSGWISDNARSLAKATSIAVKGTGFALSRE